MCVIPSHKNVLKKKRRKKEKKKRVLTHHRGSPDGVGELVPKKNHMWRELLLTPSDLCMARGGDHVRTLRLSLHRAWRLTCDPLPQSAVHVRTV